MQSILPNLSHMIDLSGISALTQILGYGNIFCKTYYDQL